IPAARAGKSLGNRGLGLSSASRRAIVRTILIHPGGNHPSHERSMSHTEVLRAELERLFDLDELIQLSSQSLGFDPTEVGSQATLGSFAGALVSYCEKEDAIFALADALRASGRDLHPRIISLLNGEPDKEALLSPGSSLG